MVPAARTETARMPLEGRPWGTTPSEPAHQAEAGGREYHPALDWIVPVVILVTSVAYAWSLRNIADPELNLLFMKPVFAIVWVFLLLVVVRDLIPSLRGLGRSVRAAPVPTKTSAEPASAISWHERFRPGTEGGAFLVVVATLVYALVALNGTVVFLTSTCIYLMLSAWLIGERHPLAMLAHGVLGTGSIYLVMGVMLGVRF